MTSPTGKSPSIEELCPDIRGAQSKTGSPKSARKSNGKKEDDLEIEVLKRKSVGFQNQESNGVLIKPERQPEIILSPVLPVEPPGLLPLSKDAWESKDSSAPIQGKRLPSSSTLSLGGASLHGKVLKAPTAGTLNTLVVPDPCGSACSSRRPSSAKDEPRRTSTLQQKPFIASHDQDGHAYVDELHPEDVGISFCIRAAADFGNPATKDPDSKHLHGLQWIFPVQKKASSQPTSRVSTGLHRAMSGLLTDKHAQSMRMMFAATSSIAVRMQLVLSMSAALSCVFVIASLSVEPACGQQVGGWIIYAHMANSILYGMVAIPSRGFFSRVDWRLGEELISPLEVLMSQLRSPGLYFDILSLGGLLAEILHRVEDHHGRTPSATQWFMLLQTLKAWRILRPEDTSGMSERGLATGFMELLLQLACFAHYIACFLIIVGNIEVARGEKSWLDNNVYDIDTSDCFVLYEEAFYFAVIGLTSVGYGDVLVTPFEHGCNSFFLLISQLFAARVCAELTWLVYVYNQHEAEAHERRRGLVLALHKMGVPRVLVKRVLAYQKYENTMHADNMEHTAFHGLSTNLMQELRLCTFRKLVLQAPFLREQQSEVISFIVNALFDSVYLPSDFIIRAGERGRELFFVRRGEAKAFLGPSVPIWGQCTEVATFKAGSYFGELAMLTGLPRGSYVMATSYCICSVLPYSGVESLVEQHPEAFTSLVQTMVKMYGLKPEHSWADISKKLTKRFGLHEDYEAFSWFRSHADNPDSEELHAKAFDKALQRLKIPDLDRRIYWSELDKDASGGISFEEFEGVLVFPEGRNGEKPAAIDSPGTQGGAKPTMVRSVQWMSLDESDTLPGKTRRTSSKPSLSRASSTCEAEQGDYYNMFCELMEQNRELLAEIKRLQHRSTDLPSDV